MTLNQEQLEWIVSEVVRRLLAATANGAAPSPAAGTLTLEERLVTLETLRGRLGGVSQLEVKPKAVVTPAVVDFLKECGVKLCRRGVTE